MKYKVVILDEKYEHMELESDDLQPIEKREAALKELNIVFSRLTEIEFRQKIGVTLPYIISEAKSELGENEFIIKGSKRWMNTDKECSQFIITYVDAVGVTRTFNITHTNMPDALVIFEELIWHKIDARIGVAIKVGA